MTAPAPWVDAVRAGTPPAPTILVLGGYLTAPPLYGPMVRRLLARGAAAAVVANTWTTDWLLLPRRGFGPICTRSSRALLAASARSAEISLGAPVLVIGHSAGGVLARLLTSPVPFAGRPLNGGGRIGGIVTLGTPHLVGHVDDVVHRNGGDVAVGAADFANEVVPGAFHAPRIGYVTVASRTVTGRLAGSARERAVWRVYQSILPDPACDAYEGDGLVPVASALLPGAHRIVLDDVAHGQARGRPWYGSEEHVDSWWPAALEAWREALAARAAAAPAPVAGGATPSGAAPAPGAVVDAPADRG